MRIRFAAPRPNRCPCLLAFHHSPTEAAADPRLTSARQSRNQFESPPSFHRGVQMSKKRSKHRSRQVAGVLGTTSVLCLSQMVRAELQTAQLDEVIVTATKRETNLQETPVAITAFSQTA